MDRKLIVERMAYLLYMRVGVEQALEDIGYFELVKALKAADEWFQEWVSLLPENEKATEIECKARGVIEFIDVALEKAGLQSD